MSKATNTVTFGKTITASENHTGGRDSWAPIRLGGVPVGTLYKRGGYDTVYSILDHEGRRVKIDDTSNEPALFVAEDLYVPHPTNPNKMRHDRCDWQTARRNAKAFAKKHFASIEMPTVIVTDDEIHIRGELVGSIARKEQCRSTGWMDRLQVVTINGATYEAHPAQSRELAIEKATEAAQVETVEARGKAIASNMARPANRVALNDTINAIFEADDAAAVEDAAQAAAAGLQSQAAGINDVINDILDADEPAKVDSVKVGPFEYEGDGAHCSELTRAGKCVGQLVKECDTDDRRVDCYRVRSWSGEIDQTFNVSAHGTARAALKAARQFAQTL